MPEFDFQCYNCGNEFTVNNVPAGWDAIVEVCPEDEGGCGKEFEYEVNNNPM